MTKSSGIDPDAASRLASTCGRSGPFSKAQDQVIKKHLREWLEYAFGTDPQTGKAKSTGTLTKWKQERAKCIMQDPDFGEYPEGFDFKLTFEAIVRKFTNYRNFRKKNLEDEKGDKEAIKNAASALLEMKACSKGRDLFREEMHSEIVKRKTEILLSGDVISPVGAYQRAVKELWEEADRDEWQKCAKGEARNISKNQERLAISLFTGLRGVAQSGEAGNLEIFTLIAHRDESGRVISSLLEVHHNDKTEHFSAEKPTEVDVPAFQLAFETWADRVLPDGHPRSAGPSSVKLSRTATGLPLFPELNLNKEAPDSVRQILQAYLEGVWGQCNPGDPCPPWDEIAKDPSKFYDIEIYPLTRSIKDPSGMSNGEVYDMASAIGQFTHPFEFFRGDKANLGVSLDLDSLIAFPDASHVHEDAPMPAPANKTLSPPGGASAYSQPPQSPTCIQSPPLPTVQTSFPPAKLVNTMSAQNSLSVSQQSSSPRAQLSSSSQRSSLAREPPPPSQTSPSPLSIPASHTLQPMARATADASFLANAEPRSVDKQTFLTARLVSPSPNPLTLPVSIIPFGTGASGERRKENELLDGKEDHAPKHYSSESEVDVTRESSECSMSAQQENCDAAPASEEGGCSTGSSEGAANLPTPSHATIAAESSKHHKAASEQKARNPCNTRGHRKNPSSTAAHASSSEGVAVERRSRRHGPAVGTNAQPTLSPRLLIGEPQNATRAGRKRVFSEIAGETGVVLSDGRRGTYKPSKKHKGGWFCEATAKGRRRVEKEWMNQDELEEVLQSTYAM